MASTVQSFVDYLTTYYNNRYGNVSIDFFNEPHHADLRIRIVKHYQKNQNPFCIYIPYYQLLHSSTVEYAIELCKQIEKESSLDGCIEQMKRVFKK